MTLDATRLLGELPAVQTITNGLVQAVNTVPAGDNSQNYATTTFANALSAHGQCRLSVASTTSLKLSAYGGNNLIINGIPEQIPTAGVTVVPTVSASTAYYVYAEMVSGVMTLILSTTGHSTASNGVETQTGNTALTLVGQVATNSSSQFVANTTTSITILNWFNRKSLALSSGLTNPATSAGTATDLSSVLHLAFISWSDESYFLSINGYVQNNVSGVNSLTFMLLDGTAIGAPSAATTAGAGQAIPNTLSVTNYTTELVLHQFIITAAVGSGTATFEACTNGIIRG